MLTRMKDGVEIEISSEEEAEIRAEWAANEVARSSPSDNKGLLERRSDESVAEAEAIIKTASPDVQPALTALLNLIKGN